MNLADLTREGARELIETAANTLLAAERHAIHANPSWCSFVSQSPGVYCLREGDDVIYVGEGGNLRARLRDMTRTLNHTLRRSLGKRLFADRPDFVPATGRRKFSDEIETLLDAYMHDRLTIAAVHLFVGRKEVEEFLVDTLEPALNSKPGRRDRWA